MTVELSISGAVATVTLSRPEARNALTVEMRTTIGDMFERIATDDAIRAVILTGAGEHFCVGGDVSKMDEADEATVRERIRAGAHRMIRSIYHLEKPVIAAVDGVAAGIGWSLAMACDFIYASPRARFSQVFKKIALAPDGGAAFFLARRVALPLAKELAFSARLVAADEALSLGLIDRMSGAAALMEDAQKMAMELAGGPTLAFGMAKKLFNASLQPTLDAFLDLELMIQPQLRQSIDHREGVAAFREKRPPQFTGR